MEGTPTRKVALPWYNREDYPRILGLMTDRHNFASTYDQWLMAAENNERVAQGAGLQVSRVMIEPQSFAQWCTKNALPPDGAARMKYVAERQPAEAPSSDNPL